MEVSNSKMFIENGPEAILSNSSMETNEFHNDSFVPMSQWLCNHTGPLIMNENYPDPSSVESAWALNTYKIIQIIAFVLVFAISVCGNLIIIIVVYQNSFLRSTINYYLVNLALSDLLITVLCWPTITNQLTHPFYILGRSLCKINVLTQTTCVTASVMTLSAVACDRVYAVLLPLRARSSAARPLTCILVIWVVAVILSLPAFVVRDVQVFQWNDMIEESCGDVSIRCSPKTQEFFRYYRILLTVKLFFLPCIVMMAAYAIILLRLWCVKRPATPAPSTTSAPPNPHIRAKRKIVKMTAMVLMAFLICWSPLHILLFYDLVYKGALPLWYDKVIFWAYFLGYCNSALNPILYGGFSDNFRMGFKNIFRERRFTSDHMLLPSTAMPSTSISVNRWSSRLSIPRRSSVLQTSKHGTQAFVVSIPRRDSLTPNKLPQYSRRSSAAISHSRRSSDGVPNSRRSSAVGTHCQILGSVVPLLEKSTNGAAHDICSARSSLQIDQHSESSFGRPGSIAESNSPDEHYSFLNEKLKNDIDGLEENFNHNGTSNQFMMEPRGIESQHYHHFVRRQSSRIENFTSIIEEGNQLNEKDQVMHDIAVM